MISEVDVRDWENIQPAKALEALNNLKPAFNSSVFYDDFQEVFSFVQKVEQLRRSQVPQQAALLNRVVEGGVE